MLNRLKKLFKDELILQTAIVFLGTGLGGFFGLLYHLASVRLLTPQDYGTFNALVSFIMITSMAVSPLVPTLTRFFTEYITKRDFARLIFTFKKLIKILIIGSGASFIIFIAAAPILADFLKTKPLYIIICGGVISVSMVGLLFPPFFQSFQKFTVYSFIGIIASFGKLAVGALLMFLGLRIFGGLLGFLASSFLILLVSLFFLPNIFKKEIGFITGTTDTKVSLMPLWRYFFPTSIAILSFTSLTTVDVMIVKHFFSSLEAGYYSIAQMVGKIVLFLPSALAVVIFPKSAKAQVNDLCPLKYLYKSLFLAGLCCLTITTISFLVPDLVLRVLVGKTNPISASLIGLFSLTMAFYALTWIIMNFLLAIHNLKFIFPIVIIALLETTLIYFNHSSLFVVLGILLFFSIMTFGILLFIARSRRLIK